MSEHYHATCTILLTDFCRIIQIESISCQTSTYDGRGMVAVHFFPELHYPVAVHFFPELQYPVAVHFLPELQYPKSYR